ncbi:MAG: cysteate synthase [Prolixibacteraceae bacterium]|nr:cysteate synthase [Prolixibacteraceae bacterium]
MAAFHPTKYHLQSLCCGAIYPDVDWELQCPQLHQPSLIRAIYDVRQLDVHDGHPGLYRFSDWLPIERMLEGSGTPVTFKSEGLSKFLGLNQLYITFNGYWPERGALMKSGTFKECEAYSVCARKNSSNGTMVVASAGNTARAFARVCSQNKIPLLLTIPLDNIGAMWFDHPLDSCVRLIACESGGDYFDAIHLSNLAVELEGFYPEGGAKNVARRDGMGTTVLSAVTTIGKIPDYYFQAIGSGTGAIAAWEANLRFLEDGRYGSNKMKLMLSQNAPFLPIKEAWDLRSPAMLPIDDGIARKQVIEINAKVLSNRKPPYALKGGLYDALMDAGGIIMAVTNQEAEKAAELFLKLEGNDVEPAAAVAVASLIKAAEGNQIDNNAVIMLNITGGGLEKFKNENHINYQAPEKIFPLEADPLKIKKEIGEMFRSE